MTRRHIGLIAAAAAALAVAGALVVAPYLPRLILEGFPPAVWPAPGSFAGVTGSAEPDSQPAGRSDLSSFDPQLRQLLAERDAKAFLVALDGRIALEHYTAGFDADTLFNSYSLIKSLIGALVLKAVSEKRIASLDDRVGGYLEDLGDEGLRAVPLRDFLQMRSGVLFEAGSAKSLSGAPEKDLEASFANPFGPLVRLHMLGLQNVAEGLTSDPAARGRFSYQNINTVILGAVLEKVYGEPLQDILSGRIWRPAGAGPAHWRRYTGDGAVSAYCCLYARARDWIAVATFLSRNGTPQLPFLPDPLWREFTGSRFSEAQVGEGQYGYHVRHDVLDRQSQDLHGRFTYFLGRGGQIVYLMPERDLVVVRFGSGAQLLHSTLYATWRTLYPKN